VKDKIINKKNSGESIRLR